MWGNAQGMPAENEDSYNDGNPVADAKIGICMPKKALANVKGFVEKGSFEVYGIDFVQGTTPPPEGKETCDDDCVKYHTLMMESTVVAQEGHHMQIGCINADGTFMTDAEEEAYVAANTRSAIKTGATVLAFAAAALLIE